MSIQLKRSLSSDINSSYVLKDGQIGIEKPASTFDSDHIPKMKIGDGSTVWSSLPYFAEKDSAYNLYLVPNNAVNDDQKSNVYELSFQSLNISVKIYDPKTTEYVNRTKLESLGFATTIRAYGPGENPFDIALVESGLNSFEIHPTFTTKNLPFLVLKLVSLDSSSVKYSPYTIWINNNYQNHSCNFLGNSTSIVKQKLNFIDTNFNLTSAVNFYVLKNGVKQTRADLFPDGLGTSSTWGGKIANCFDTIEPDRSSPRIYPISTGSDINEEGYITLNLETGGLSSNSNVSWFWIYATDSFPYSESPIMVVRNWISDLDDGSSIPTFTANTARLIGYLDSTSIGVFEVFVRINVSLVPDTAALQKVTTLFKLPTSTRDVFALSGSVKYTYSNNGHIRQIPFVYNHLGTPNSDDNFSFLLDSDLITSGSDADKYAIKLWYQNKTSTTTPAWVGLHVIYSQLL